MSGTLSALCSHYYKMKLKMRKHDDRCKVLFDNMLTFDGNATVDEIDAILASGRRVATESEKAMIAFEKFKETEQRILFLLKSVGVRPRWYLTGQIPGEIEYEVFYDTNENVYVIKTKDIEPEPENPNIITIKFSPPLDDEFMLYDDDDDDNDDDEE